MNTFGRVLTVSVFGQSHSASIGCVIDHFPAGLEVDEAALAAFMARRAPGQGPWATKRSEADEVRFLSGLNARGRTNGAPIALAIANTDTRPKDYSAMGKVPRPSHADLVAWRRWGDDWDRSGGGQFSGRLTAPLTAAGALSLQWLAERGVHVAAHLQEVAGVLDEPFRARMLDVESRIALEEQVSSLAARDFPTLSEAAGAAMRKAISEAASEGDSVGGIIEVVATGVPEDLGSPMALGVESQVSSALFGIPAVKGVEFGAGFEAARMRGSEHNDPYTLDARMDATPEKNDAGGILGGITTGAPLVVRIAVKPTASIAKSQRSVDLETMEETELRVRGRHDPCIAPRAVPVAEAVLGLTIMDLMLERLGTRASEPRPTA